MSKSKKVLSKDEYESQSKGRFETKIEDLQPMQCKPKWDEHKFAAICLTGNGDWFGLYEAVKPFYSNEWKGQEVTIAHGQGEFIKHSNITNLINIEQYYEVRPIVIIGTEREGKTRKWMKDLLINAPDGAAYWSPALEQYFDSQYMNLHFKSEGKLIQVEPQFRDELVPLAT